MSGENQRDEKAGPDRRGSKKGTSHDPNVDKPVIPDPRIEDPEAPADLSKDRAPDSPKPRERR